MLIRNLTKFTLKIGYGLERIALPPMQVINIDEHKFPADYIKRHFGNYVQLLTEKAKADEEEVQAKAKEDLGPKEGGANVPNDNEAGKEGNAEDKVEGDNAGAVDNAGADNNIDANDADAKDDKGAADADKADEEKPAKATAKAAKSGKKTKKN